LITSAIGGNDSHAFLYAFDLIELNGDDLRRDPLEVRKATLAKIVARAGHGIWFNDHIEEEDGETVFRHACKLGLEGIVSKRKGSPYRSGRSPDWLKMKNPACAAVKREEEEDWGAVKDTLAVLGHLLVCAVLSLLAGFMIWEIVEYAHPEWKAQLWGSHAKGQ